MRVFNRSNLNHDSWPVCRRLLELLYRPSTEFHDLDILPHLLRPDLQHSVSSEVHVSMPTLQGLTVFQIVNEFGRFSKEMECAT
jgi:hypothetical protein